MTRFRINFLPCCFASMTAPLFALLLASFAFFLCTSLCAQERCILGYHENGKRYAEIGSLAFSPDGKRLVSCGSKDIVKIWDVEKEKELGVFSHGATPQLVAFIKEGKQFVCFACNSAKGEKIVMKAWDTATLKEVGETEFKGAWWPVALSGDGKILATAAGEKQRHTIKIWDVATAKLLGSIRMHKESCYRLVMSPKGDVIATASQEGTVTIADVKTEKVKHTLEGFDALGNLLALSADGKILATRWGDKAKDFPVAKVRLWSVETGKGIDTFETKERVEDCLLFLPNGKRVAYGGHSDLRTFSTALCAPMPAIEAKLNDKVKRGGIIDTMAVSPDGKLLATADFVIKLWNLPAD